MEKHRDLPAPVLGAAVAANLCQFLQLALCSFAAAAFVGLAAAVAGGFLLVKGTPLGWGVMLIWSVSVLSAPFIFATALWPILPGALVAAALLTKQARRYCLTSPGPDDGGRPALTGLGPAAASRGHSHRFRDAPYRLQGLIEAKRYALALKRRRYFLIFLGATFVFLPLSGIMERVRRSSGRDDVLVEVAYHFVAVCLTLSLLGLVFMFLSLLRRPAR